MMNSHSREQATRREKTLFAAVLLSMWAPLATGIAVVVSQSTTQIADFVRRTVELVALLVSWQVFRYLERRKRIDPGTKAALERFAGLSVAAALGCSGIVMLLLAYSRLFTFEPGGNVYPGLVIAGLGLVTNGWFWRRYAALLREQYNPIIASQRQLYRAKSAVDLCVIVALGAVAISPAHPVTRYLDLFGSIAVALYLLWSGVWPIYKDKVQPRTSQTLFRSSTDS
jgi:divalent metal cation (Fe/Co/Zn/Cd) transporter